MLAGRPSSFLWLWILAVVAAGATYCREAFGPAAAHLPAALSWVYLAGAAGFYALLRRTSQARKPLLLLALLGLGLPAVFVLPHTVFAWPDSINYLTPALTLEARGHLEPTFRELAYPLVVAAASAFGSPPRTVFLVQCAAGFAAGAYLILAWLKLGALLFPAENRPDWYLGLGALMIASFISAGSVIYYEIHLMPEAIFPLVAAAAFYHTLALLAELSGRKRLFVAAAHAFLSIFLLLMSYPVMPRWGFGVALAGVPAIALLRSKRGALSLRAAVVVAPIVLAVFGYFLPERALDRRYFPRGDIYLDMHLFCLNAPMVQREIDREIASGNSAFARPVLIAVRDCIQAEFDRSRREGAGGPSPSLGYNPDNLIYRDSVIEALGRWYHGDPEAVRGFLTHFYWSAWRHQPGRMLSKIATELLIFYHPDSEVASGSGYEIFVSQEARDSVATLVRHNDPLLFAQSAWHSYQARVESLSDSPISLRQSVLTTCLHRLINATYFWCVALLALSAFVACACRVRNPGSRRVAGCLGILGLGLFLLSFNLCSTLTLAVVHSVDSPRYRESELVLTAFGWAASLACLAVAARRCRQAAPAPDSMPSSA